MDTEDTFALLSRLRGEIAQLQARNVVLEAENAELRLHIATIAARAERLAQWIPAIKEFCEVTKGVSE